MNRPLATFLFWTAVALAILAALYLQARAQRKRCEAGGRVFECAEYGCDCLERGRGK